MAALEAELAHNIKELGHKLLGKHPRKRLFDKRIFSEIWGNFRKELFPNKIS